MQSRPRQIIAIGGGGLSSDPNDLVLDRYVLAQAGVPEPKVAFVPTASGDADSYLVRFYAAFSGLRCRPSCLPLFRRTPELRTYLLAQNIIYVGGGNTKSMLAVWREWGLPELLQEAWTSGIVLAGVSAGAICWFEQGVTDAFADRLRVLPCLGLLPGSCCPHYDGEVERRPTYHELLQRGEIKPGIGIDNHVGVHFLDTEIHQVVSSRQGATAYRVSLRGREVSEEPLPALSSSDRSMLRDHGSRK